MTATQFATIIGQIESESAWDAWGDGGGAMGRFQVHPEWVYTWAYRLVIAPILIYTWDRWIECIVKEFFLYHFRNLTPVEIAMHYHVGHTVLANSPEWDTHYAARFEAEAAKLPKVE